MKNILSTLAFLFFTTIVVAQDVKKNSYFLDGNIIEATLYYDNGEVAQTGFYTEDNKLTGEWISYDLIGTKTAVAQYKDGEKVGTWIFYQGDTKREVSYSDSRIAKVETWKITDTNIVSNNP